MWHISAWPDRLGPKYFVLRFACNWYTFGCWRSLMLSCVCCAWQSYDNKMIMPEKLSRGRLQWVWTSLWNHLHIWFNYISYSLKYIPICCVHSLGLIWKERGHMSACQQVWSLMRQREFWCVIPSCPGPSSTSSSRSPGGSLVPYSTCRQSTRIHLSSSSSSSHTPCAWLVRRYAGSDVFIIECKTKQLPSLIWF